MSTKWPTIVNICDRLREERVRLNATQADAAKAAGVGFSTYQTYEKGDRFPNAEALYGLYLAGFDMLYIVTGARNSATLSNEETVLLTQFGQLDARGRALILGVMRIYGEKHAR